MNSLLPKTSISALLPSAALIIAIASPLQGQSTSYVPALQAREGADLGLALVNPTLSEARVTLTARDYTGAIIRNNAITNPVTLALPASGQIAVRAAQLFGSGISGQAGWLEVSASTPAVKGVFSAFNSGFSFIELGEFARPASRLIFPKVSGSSATELTLVNTASEDVQATLSLYRNDGQLFSTKSMTIPAFSGFTRSIDELALSAANFEGYAVIDSGVGPGSGILESLVGFETYRNGSDIALVRAFPESSRLRTGFMAHFVSQGGYSSKLTLVNFSGDSQVLRITASGLQAGGSPQTPSSATVERTPAPNARLEESVEQMFNFPGQALIDGYIHFETATNTSGVFGFLDYGMTDGVGLSAIEAQREGYSNLFFSQVAEGASYYTGLALLNSNNESSIVTLDTFDASGNRTGSTVVNLNPGERVARLLSEFLQRDVTQFGGYVRITATRPVFALGLFGSSNPPTLASVPAQGESLKPQTSGREVDASLGANVISGDGSTSLLIPSKSLKSNTSINVAPISINGLPSPSGGRQPIAAVEATPDGTQFQIPVRLTFPLNANLDRGTKIPLLIFDPQTDTYQATEFVATVDKSGRTASAEVTRFTQYVASISESLVAISNITPSTVSPGDTITITSSGFCSSRPQTSVKFAGANNTSVQGTVLSVSATSIQAQVPAGAVTGPVTVHACKQTSTGYAITVASTNPAPGTISISPSSITTGTTSVTLQIAGTNLMAQSVVYYDSTPVADTFVDTTLLTVTLGALSTAGIHHLYVVNPAPRGGTSNVVDFTVVDPTTGAFGISTALQLDKTTVNPGQTLNATVTYKNSTSSAVTINAIVITSRPPWGTNPGGPYMDLSPTAGVTTVQPGATVQLSASRAFTTSDPTGTWYAYATYQDSVLVWHDGPSVNFTVSTAAPTNQAPVVNAGPDQTITLPSSATLNGTATDDRLPAGSTLTTTWSKVSGPGTVTFNNASATNTTASFSASGAYVLRLTATDSALQTSDDIAITVNPGPAPTPGVLTILTGLALNKTTISAGQTLNATVTYKNTGDSAITINVGAITSRPPGGTNSGGPYDDLSPAVGVTTLQPAATLTISASRAFTSADPIGTWYAFSTYQDSSLAWHDGPNVSFTVSSSTNQPPTVNAGSNQAITLPASAALSGSASDDGLPSGTLTTTWSKSSGPGTVTFGSGNALSTTASFSTSGTYVLQLTASDGALSSSSTVTIVVNSSSSTGNTYYVSNSGSDSNSGTSTSSSWKTIAKVQSFLGSLRAGDSVLFERGGIWYEKLDVNNVNGSPGLPIVFGNYGSGNLPIIDGGGTKSGFSVNGGRQWCIGGQSSKMSYITIDGFECRNTSAYGIAFVGVSAGSAGIVVQDSYIHDTGNGDTGYHNQLMFAEYNFGANYGTKFLNNKVGNCYGHNCIQIHGDRGSPLIQGNECYGSSHNCIDVKYVTGAIVDSNVVHDGLGNQPGENAFYIENAGSSGDVTWTRNVVYGSVSQSGFQCGQVNRSGNPVTCYVYNNTVYGTAVGAFGGSDFSTNFPILYVKNNIFNTSQLWRGDTRSFAAWDYNDRVQGQSQPTGGSHDMVVDPLFVNPGANDFHLQSTSPVIGMGTNVGLPYSGSAPDLGAYQYRP